MALEKPPVSTLIIGQGLIGTLLAFEKLEEGEEIRLIDRGLKFSTSNKFPVILSPLDPIGDHTPLFNKLKEKWKSQLTPLEKLLSAPILHHKPTYHLFKTQAERQETEAKLSTTAKELMAHPLAPNTLNHLIGDNAGGFELRNTSYIYTPLFLRLARKYFIEEGLLIEKKFEKKDFIAGTSSFQWKSLKPSTLTFCIGHQMTVETSIESWPELPKTHIIRLGNTTYIPHKGDIHIQTITDTPIPKEAPISLNSHITSVTNIW
jgi:hypothetical protein